MKECKSIAFDVDGTLIKKGLYGEDVPRYDVIDLFHWFNSKNYYMYIWSGGGTEYAKRWSEKLGLTAGHIIVKQPTDFIDIAVDDEDVLLGAVNIKV